MKVFNYLSYICVFTAALAMGCGSDTSNLQPGTSQPVIKPVTPIPIDNSLPAISAFNPPSGTYALMPTIVAVYFSKAMDGTNAASVSNWTLTCPSGRIPVLSSVITGAMATLTLPDLSSLPSGTSCNLSASNGIQDSTGNLLLGGGTVNYTTTTTGPTSVDTTSPTGNITLPLAEERVFGTLSFSATAQDVGSFPSGVASVEFWIGESLAAVSTSAPYRANINTAHYANGPTQVSLLVRDHAGNEFAFADTQTIHIQNHALSTLPAAGSPAGTVYNEIPGGRYSLAGLNVRVDRFTVRSAQPIWATSFGSVSRYNGHFHGVAIGDSHSLECTDPSSRVVGIWGRSDTKIHRIGIICKKLDGTDRTEYVGALGGVDGRFFERVCPQDTLVTQLEGSFTNSLNSLRVRCK